MSDMCKCGSPHDNWTSNDGDYLCQDCWEREVDAAWWDAVNRIIYYRTNHVGSTPHPTTSTQGD